MQTKVKCLLYQPQWGFEKRQNIHGSDVKIERMKWVKIVERDFGRSVGIEVRCGE